MKSSDWKVPFNWFVLLDFVLLVFSFTILCFCLSKDKQILWAWKWNSIYNSWKSIKMVRYICRYIRWCTYESMWSHVLLFVSFEWKHVRPSFLFPALKFYFYIFLMHWFKKNQLNDVCWLCVCVLWYFCNCKLFHQSEDVKPIKLCTYF